MYLSIYTYDIQDRDISVLNINGNFQFHIFGITWRR